MNEKMQRQRHLKERIKNFNEFHTPLSKEEQQKAGLQDVWTVACRSVRQE